MNKIPLFSTFIHFSEHPGIGRPNLKLEGEKRKAELNRHNERMKEHIRHCVELLIGNEVLRGVGICIEGDVECVTVKGDEEGLRKLNDILEANGWGRVSRFSFSFVGEGRLLHQPI